MQSTLQTKIYLLLQQVTDGFQSLRGSPKELTKAYILKFLDSYSYFSLRLILTLFLSSDFGYSDVQAGTIYGAWGALITVYGLAAGCIMDHLGVAYSLRIGFAISLVARVVIFVTTSRVSLLLMVGLVLPFGNCLGIPVLATGIRRYTTQANRGFAFGLFYVVMNVAALLSGPVMDICTIWYKGSSANAQADANEDAADNNNQNDEKNIPWSLTGYRLVILTGIIANLAALLISFTVREIKVQDDDTEEEEEESEEYTSSSSPSKERIAMFQPSKESAWTSLKDTLHTANFWRFLVVCLLTLNLRMIFTHLDATLPKYMMREFGENIPKGSIYAINPALIIILVPIITAATTKVNPLVMIHHGGYISALSVFFLVVSTSIESCILFTVVLSIGEAIWSPRLYDYTMSVTKEGREGIYMALSSAPLFLAKLPVGFLSGYLLQKYCPEEGPRSSKTMWLIIGLSTIASPILLSCLWGYVSKTDNVDATLVGQEKKNGDYGPVQAGDLDGLTPPLIPSPSSRLNVSRVQELT